MTSSATFPRQVADLIPPGTTIKQGVAYSIPMIVIGVAERDHLGSSSTVGLRLPLAVGSAEATLVTLMTPRTSYGRVADTDRRSFADSLQRIQQRTQLDWGQIARTLGVSRRTVHNWLTGTRVNGVNAGRLAYFYKAVLQELTGRSPEDGRTFLLTPDETGVTPLARITTAVRR